MTELWLHPRESCSQSLYPSTLHHSPWSRGERGEWRGCFGSLFRDYSGTVVQQLGITFPPDGPIFLCVPCGQHSIMGHSEKHGTPRKKTALNWIHLFHQTAIQLSQITSFADCLFNSVDWLSERVKGPFCLNEWRGLWAFGAVADTASPWSDAIAVLLRDPSQVLPVKINITRLDSEKSFFVFSNWI